MKQNKAPKGKGRNIREGKKKTINEAIKKAKKFLFKDNTSSSDELVNYHNICDDNSSDYVDDDSNMCMICCESGKSNELWYRCRACGEWAHAQCSGSDSVKDYVCDFCIRQ
ncbi:hypothetical protein ILUMI_11895 [Ignelater luminosus]|uniref:Zinc finger PHD-type domain-containing protein n=1 Tax=Ignelater luminosus TaxID=2038154 RepID=A0A8K0D429_IGNLU|nr:hypothetical protein ILUMI_11895 [Ignelater luminosus]